MARTDVEPAGSLQGREGCIEFASNREFLSGEGRESHRPLQIVRLVTEDLEKVYNLPIQVVVGFHAGGRPVEEDCTGAGEWLAVVRSGR